MLSSQPIEENIRSPVRCRRRPAHVVAAVNKRRVSGADRATITACTEVGATLAPCLLPGDYSDSGIERSDSVSSSEDDVFFGHRVATTCLSTGVQCTPTNSANDTVDDSDESTVADTRQVNGVVLEDKVTDSVSDATRNRDDLISGTAVPAYAVSALTALTADSVSSENCDCVRRRSSTLEVLLDPQQWKWLREPEFIVDGSQKIQTTPKTDVHSLTDSLFSTSSGFTNYRGLLNLCIVLLVLSNARVAIENIIKYGILIEPFFALEYILRDPYTWPCLLILLASNLFIIICFMVECALSKKLMSEKLGLAVHIANCTASLIFPALVILIVHPNPLTSSITLGIYTCLFMKMISYAAVNKWCRQRLTSPRRRKAVSVHVGDGDPPAANVDDNDDVSSSQDGSTMNGAGAATNVVKIQRYPENLNYTDLFYFLMCPTLCYELNFPRSARIRIRFLLKRVIEMLFLSQIISALIQQWMIPTVRNSLVPFMNSEYSVVVTRIFKLAIPNHFIWLLFFYWLFHSCLNVVAELLRFGDREFYKDWWNAETVPSFWNTWNIPVHRWARRHVFVPMLKFGFTKMQASVTVFLLSAFFHEYLVSVPLRMFKLWSFMGMAGQIPFAFVVGKFLHGKYGNMAVWLSLILGQPIAILMYVHDYCVLHASDISGLTAPAL